MVRRVLTSTRDRVRGTHPALAVLLLLALLQGIGWTAATAPFNGPDEIAHFAYVQHLAETGDGPQRNEGSGVQSSEVGAALGELQLYPIVGHLDAKPAWDAVDGLTKRLDQAPSSVRKDGSGPNPAGNYPPLYDAYGALAYKLSPDHSLLARVAAVRLAGVLLLLVTVVLAWLIAAELFVRTWPRVVLAGMVALQPKLGFMAGVVNPDIALVVETTALLLVALRTVRTGPTVWRLLGLGLLAGAGVLTHGRGLALVPPAAIAALLGLWRFRSAGILPALRLVVPGAVALVVCGLAAVAYTSGHAGGAGAYGGQAGVSKGANVREFLSYTWQFYFPKLADMIPRHGPAYGWRQVFIETHFGSFGSLEVNYRPATYDRLQVASALGIVAVYSAALLRWRAVAARWAEVVVMLVTLVAMLGLLHVVSYSALLTSEDPIITGRYLLPCVAVYAAAIAWVCASLPRRAGPALGGVLLALSAILSIGGLGETLARFHA